MAQIPNLPSNAIASSTTTASSNGAIRLAPDLDWPDRITTNKWYEDVTVNPAGALTTVLSLTGKYAVSFLELTGIPNTENMTVKMTVDGVVIWNHTKTFSTASVLILWGSNTDVTSTTLRPTFPFIVNESLLIEIETVTDTNVGLYWVAVPIL